MIRKTLVSWVKVNEYMDDEFRQQVVADALAHYQNSSADLRKFAMEALRNVTINGFRPFPHIPLDRLKTAVTSKFKTNNRLATTVICLWAEVHTEIIAAVRHAAEDANISINPNWGWENARNGFIGFDDIPDLNEVATKLSEQHQKPESDHYLLAALWLSQGLIREEVKELVTQSVGERNQPVQVVTAPEVRAHVKIAERYQAKSIQAEPILTQVKHPEPLQQASDLDRKSIEELSLYWDTQSAEIIGARDSFLAKVEELRSAALSGEPNHATEKIKQLGNNLQAWEKLKSQSEELVDYIQARVTRELQFRPDIKEVQSEVSVLSEHPTETELLAILPIVFQAITSYDTRKVVSIGKATSVRNELLLLEQSLSLWKTDVVPLRHQIQQLNDPQDLSLQQLLTTLENSRKVLQEAKEKRLQARGITIRRILDTLQKMDELPAAQEIQLSKYRPSELIEQTLEGMPGRELQEIEREVLTVFNQMVAKANTGNSQKIASSLRACWNDGILEQLLGHLADEKKDLAAVLLEMAAVVVHPRTERSVYSRAIARSLFNGISELSTDTNPYHLLNKLASYFFVGWTSSDPVARYERCVLALAALAGNNTGLPPGFLWQVETDWPEASMPSWDRLWQSVLLEEDIEIYTDQKIVEIQAVLESQQKEIEILFAKDGGHYLRVSSIKSDRHRIMVNNQIFPQFLGDYAALTKLRKQFETVSVEKHPKVLNELKRTMDALERSLIDKRLEEIYQKGVTEYNIDDINPFHAKVCMRVLAEISTAIMDYGRTLLTLESLRSIRRDGLNYDSLSTEVNRASNTNSLVQHALDQIVQGTLKARMERNEDAECAQGIQHIITKILSDASYVHRFPQTIALLVQEPLNWEQLLDTLLADAETPQDVLSAAQFLLDNHATYQVLQAVQQIPLDIQKLAQNAHRDQEKRINDLEDEFIKLGGDIEWAKPDHELGRWGYLSTRLSEEIARSKKRTEEEHQHYENEAFAIRDQINRLDMNIFKSRSSIPVGIVKILQKGLDTARKTTEVSRLLPQLKEYLDEVEYRLSRESWIEAELENATQELEKQLLGTHNEVDASMDVEQILKAFNAGELAKLGLDAEEFEDSKITTRVNVLDNWLAIRNFHTVLSSKLNRVEINKIKSMFSYFARMNQMHHSRGADNNYMSYDNPLVHEYWELRHPRTPALTRQCVMIASPGNPPSADDLQSIDEFLEKEDFLAAHFVFLFVPGCTPKIAKRLTQNYAKQGVVLIDEPALIRMVLAERENSMVPLGRLRPIMLNSTGANADIFTVNQSVNSHTSIFFGRDSLIERIASSGDNYAIYGGRRIGKSSVLKALEQLLEFRKERVVSYSLEGDTEYSEQYIAKRLANRLGIQREYEQSQDFKTALFSYFEQFPDESVVLILDEIDRYISENSERHTLIEALRATSDRFEHRFRVIIAGFMELYDCLDGRGPYTPSSDPWRRMLNNMGPLENLKPPDAEEIVQMGFLSILGWNFEHRAIPRRIVERTGGHPAFVQYFCLKLQEQVSKRGDQIVTLKDIDTVFDDDTPEKSFIWFVRKTLEMNLSDPAYKQKSKGENISDPVSRYLLLWLALDTDTNTAQTFTLDQIREIANSSSVHIPEKVLMRSLDLLTVTSVVREKSSQLYEFTVPDYPLILNRLGEGSQLEALEAELKAFLESVET